MDKNSKYFKTNFFPVNKNICLEDIATACNLEISSAQKSLKVSSIKTLKNATKDDITFFENSKYLEDFKKTEALACFLKPKYLELCPENTVALVTDDPYMCFAKALNVMFPDEEKADISDKAYISPTAIIGKNCTIEPNVYIGDKVVIGDNCYFASNSSVRCSIIGNNFRLLSNSSIGQDGFGYAMSARGHLRVKQVGKVVIGDDVEIGANSCVDRGALEDTLIGDGTKIDNLVQIAHNVEIGKHCVIASEAGIAGSAKIGNFVIIGGGVGIAGHTKIGDAVKIAAYSGIMRDIEPYQTVAGQPARPIRQWHKSVIAIDKLVDKINNKSNK